MFFLERKPEKKTNVGKIVAVSVAATFAVAAAVYGLYMFLRKYCSLCRCDDDFLDDDFDCDCDSCDCECDTDDDKSDEDENEDETKF